MRAGENDACSVEHASAKTLGENFDVGAGCQ